MIVDCEDQGTEEESSRPHSQKLSVICSNNEQLHAHTLSMQT